MRPIASRTVITLPKLAQAGADSSAPHAERAGPETQPLPEPNSIDAGAPPQRAAASRRTHSSFAPVLMLGLAVSGWLGFQGWQLAADRQSLQAAHAGQQQTVDKAAQLRSALDALAADTQRLADTGNASARLLVEELKKRGVTINAAATKP